MKQAYLKWYYGYKNFGDELLFFGVVHRIFFHYSKLQQLMVEVDNKSWMEYWVQKNYQKYISKEQYSKLIFIETRQHNSKYTTHFLSFLWFGKQKKIFKFFGGGEVLSDERNFPHDGRNIPLLFSSTVRRKNFMLLGGIWTPKKSRTKRLYKILLSRAKGIITRDETSYKTALRRNNHSLVYQDFSQDIILKNKQNTEKKDTYVLINCNKKSWNQDTRQKIIDFCKKYAQHKKIYFPCDMSDDSNYFTELQKDIPDLEMYDWTKYQIEESLSLFQWTTAAIWARLHFLLPLKLYKKEFTAIKYAEKIYKMID